MKKIAIITPIFDPESDDRKVRNIVNLALKLFHLGNRITVFTTTAISTRTYKSVFKKGEFIYKGIDIYRFESKIIKEFGNFQRFTKWIFSGLHSRRDESNWHRQAGPVVPDLLSRAVELEENFDYFFIYGEHSFLNFNIAKRIKKPKILFVLDTNTEIMNLDMFKETLENSTVLVFYSQAQKELYFRIFNSIKDKKSYVIYPVTEERVRSDDTTKFKLKHRIDNPYLLYYGPLNETSGVGRLLKYYLYYKKLNFASLDLLLMGRREMPMIDDNSIKILEIYDDKAVFTALKGALFSIHPSLKDVLSYDMMLSLKAGKTFIADTRNQNYNDFIERTKSGIGYSSYFEFQESVNYLLNNREVRLKLNRRAYSLYRTKFKEEKILNEFLAYLENL